MPTTYTPWPVESEYEVVAVRRPIEAGEVARSHGHAVLHRVNRVFMVQTERCYPAGQVHRAHIQSAFVKRSLLPGHGRVPDLPTGSRKRVEIRFASQHGTNLGFTLGGWHLRYCTCEVTCGQRTRATEELNARSG